MISPNKKCLQKASGEEASEETQGWSWEPTGRGGKGREEGGPCCFSFAQLLVLSLPLTQQSQTSWLGLVFFSALYKNPRVKNVSPLELSVSPVFLSVWV